MLLAIECVGTRCQIARIISVLGAREDKVYYLGNTVDLEESESLVGMLYRAERDATLETTINLGSFVHALCGEKPFSAGL